jgi:hypothetical protein
MAERDIIPAVVVNASPSSVEGSADPNPTGAAPEGAQTVLERTETRASSADVAGPDAGGARA